MLALGGSAQDEARKLVEEGLTVLPAHRQKKHPAVAWARYVDTPPSDDEYEVWFSERFADANYWLVTGHQVVVVDADNDDAIAWMLENVTHTPRRVRTGRGMHFYYKANPNLPLQNSANAHKKIDIRGIGGGVVSPGSIHENGNIYTRIDDEGVDVWWQELPMLKPADVQLIRGFNSHASAPTSSFSIYEAGSQQGSRNNDMAQHMGVLTNGHMTHEQRVESARLLNSVNNPPLPDAEVLGIVDSIEKTHSRKHAEPINTGVTTVSRVTTVPAPEEPRKLTPVPFQLGDAAALPRREFVYSHAYPRGVVSVTVAPGGLGKSTIITAEAVAMASGKPIMGVNTEPRRCWLWNLEDPLDEIQRKIYAIAQHHEIDQADLGDRLYVNSGRDEPLILATAIGGTNILTPAADELTKHIKDNAIDCVIVDPFVSSHQLSENDNVAIDMVTKRWAQIASDTNCAIHLVHHVRKDNGMGAASVADARGASALVDAARFVRRLQRMTAEEARNAGIDEDQFWRYTREGDSKNNLSPPNSDSTWRQMVSVELANGDNVGVVEPWSWPDAFSDVTRTDVEAVQRKVAQGDWRENQRAKDWVGNAVAGVLNLDLSDAYVKAKVRNLVATWLKNDALRVVERPDSQRHMRKFVTVGKWLSEGEIDE